MGFVINKPKLKEKLKSRGMSLGFVIERLQISRVGFDYLTYVKKGKDDKYYPVRELSKGQVTTLETTLGCTIERIADYY